MRSGFTAEELTWLRLPKSFQHAANANLRARAGVTATAVTPAAPACSLPPLPPTAVLPHICGRRTFCGLGRSGASRHTHAAHPPFCRRRAATAGNLAAASSRSRVCGGNCGLQEHKISRMTHFVCAQIIKPLGMVTTWLQAWQMVGEVAVAAPVDAWETEVALVMLDTSEAGRVMVVGRRVRRGGGERQGEKAGNAGQAVNVVQQPVTGQGPPSGQGARLGSTLRLRRPLSCCIPQPALSHSGREYCVLGSHHALNRSNLEAGSGSSLQARNLNECSLGPEWNARV